MKLVSPYWAHQRAVNGANITIPRLRPFIAVIALRLQASRPVSQGPLGLEKPLTTGFDRRHSRKVKLF